MNQVGGQFQPRRINGQFGEIVRADAAMPNTESMATEFLYPSSRFPDADSHLQFYLHDAEVPSVVLSNARFMYGHMREEQVRDFTNDRVRELNIGYLRREPDALAVMKRMADPETGDQNQAEFRNEHRKAERERRPMTLEVVNVDPIVRACEAWYLSGNLSPEESAKVDQALTMVDGVEMTLEEVYDKYQGNEWLEGALTLSDMQQVTKSDKIIELLQKQIDLADGYEIEN